MCLVGVGFKEDCMVKVTQNRVGIAGLVIMGSEPEVLPPQY